VHQLWLSTVSGAAPLPLTFGDSDRRNARWSPDGSRIAYIGNDTATELVPWMSSVAPAGDKGAEAHHRTPRGQLILDVVDEHGDRIPSRSRIGSTSRLRAGRGLMHGDDGLPRDRRPNLLPHLPPCLLGFRPQRRIRRMASSTPSGKVDRGTRCEDHASRCKSASVGLYRRLDQRPACHMNYGGTTQHTDRPGGRRGRRNLDLVYNLIVNKERAFRTSVSQRR
jgi:hypothetical protein